MIQLIKTFFKLKLVILFGVLNHSNLYAQVQDVEPKALVVIFGDSITQGYNANNIVQPINPVERVRVNYALPDRLLTNLLSESCRANLVENWGWGGSSSLNGALRIRGNLDLSKQSYPESEGYTDRYILIFYGTNDFGYKISNADTQTYIQYMIEQSRVKGFKPVVATLIKRLDRPGVVETRNSFIKAGAQAESAPIIDLYSIFDNDPRGYAGLIDPDLIHPNDDGLELIAQQWFGYLETQIEAKKCNVVLAPIIQLLLDD